MRCQQILTRMHPITMAEKPLFDRYFSRYPQYVCEATFQDIFVRTELRHFLYFECDGHLLISFRSREGCLQLLPPVGPDPEKVMREGFEGFSKYHWVRIHEELAQKLRDKESELDLDNSDYLYSLEELRSLAGGKFDGKRNFVKRMEQRNPVLRRIDGSMAADLIAVQETWLESQSESQSARDESSALMKAATHYDALGLHGIAAEVDGEIVGFAIGEPLNAGTFIEHYEKALPGYTGLYPWLTHNFAKSVPPPYTILNREQDLGIEGLRKSKESWNPVGRTLKYTWKVHTDSCPVPGEMTV